MGTPSAAVRFARINVQDVTATVLEQIGTAADQCSLCADVIVRTAISDEDVQVAVMTLGEPDPVISLLVPVRDCVRYRSPVETKRHPSSRTGVLCSAGLGQPSMGERSLPALPSPVGGRWEEGHFQRDMAAADDVAQRPYRASKKLRERRECG